MGIPTTANVSPVDERVSGMIRQSLVSQAEVAAALGLSRQSVCDRMQGRTGYRAQELPAIADLLDVTVSELLGES